MFVNTVATTLLLCANKYVVFTSYGRLPYSKSKIEMFSQNRKKIEI